MITWREVICKCGCGLNLTTKFYNTINDLREEYGKPIIVISGARCESHNTKVGGREFSAHIEGRAVDLERTPSLVAFCTAENLERFELFMEGLKHTKTWVHLSDRPYGSWKPGMSRTFKP